MYVIFFYKQNYCILKKNVLSLHCENKNLFNYKIYCIMKKIIILVSFILMCSVKSFSEITTYVAMDGTVFLSTLYSEEGTVLVDNFHDINLAIIRSRYYRVYRKKYHDQDDFNEYSGGIYNRIDITKGVGDDVSDEEISNQIETYREYFKKDIDDFLRDRYYKNVDRIKRELNYYISWEEFYERMKPVFRYKLCKTVYLTNNEIEYAEIGYFVDLHSLYVKFANPGRWWKPENEILLCYLRDEDEQKRIKHIIDTYEGYVENPHKYGLNVYSHDYIH